MRIVQAAPARMGPTTNGMITSQESVRRTISARSSGRSFPDAERMIVIKMARLKIHHSIKIKGIINGSSIACLHPKSLSRVTSSMASLPQPPGGARQAAGRRRHATERDDRQRQGGDPAAGLTPERLPSRGADRAVHGGERDHEHPVLLGH